MCIIFLAGIVLAKKLNRAKVARIIHARRKSWQRKLLITPAIFGVTKMFEHLRPFFVTQAIFKLRQHWDGQLSLLSVKLLDSA